MLGGDAGRRRRTARPARPRTDRRPDAPPPRPPGPGPRRRHARPVVLGSVRATDGADGDRQTRRPPRSQPGRRRRRGPRAVRAGAGRVRRPGDPAALRSRPRARPHPAQPLPRSVLRRPDQAAHPAGATRTRHPPPGSRGPPLTARRVVPGGKSPGRDSRRRPHRGRLGSGGGPAERRAGAPGGPAASPSSSDRGTGPNRGRTGPNRGTGNHADQAPAWPLFHQARVPPTPPIAVTTTTAIAVGSITTPGTRPAATEGMDQGVRPPHPSAVAT